MTTIWTSDGGQIDARDLDRGVRCPVVLDDLQKQILALIDSANLDGLACPGPYQDRAVKLFDDARARLDSPWFKQ